MGAFPVQRVEGSPRRLGAQLGRLYREAVVRGCEDAKNSPPPMASTEVADHVARASVLLQRDFPALYDEQVAVADAAGVPFDLYLLSMYEELWDGAEDSEMTRGCTDIVAKGEATLSGELLVGHNNDLSRRPGDMVLVEYRPEGSVPFVAFSMDGVSVSSGANRAGVVLTGNETENNDVRPGLPRLLLVREACGAESIAEARRVLLHPDRASSYNNILSDAQGNVLDIEAGARGSAEVPLVNGMLAHTNHYRVLTQKAVEPPTETSDYRLRRATYLLDRDAGTHTVRTFQRILSDHRRDSDGICRHGAGNAQTKFSTVFQPEQGVVHFCVGNPCVTPFQRLPYF